MEITQLLIEVRYLVPILSIRNVDVCLALIVFGIYNTMYIYVSTFKIDIPLKRRRSQIIKPPAVTQGPRFTKELASKTEIKL
jgi:hypothetical protein